VKLLLQSEAAEFLGCSEQKVKRLRLSGRLPYIPGRPVLLDEADLVAFLEEERLSRERREEARRPKPRPPMDPAKWARIAILLRRR
jgi:excisionase family DNA binding protein